jgi:hypothetical protein
MFSALEIQIDECCVHSSLWRTASQATTFPPSLVRLGMLNRTMKAAMTYLDTLLQMTRTQMFRISTQAWTSWFHIVIVICKLVFLRDDERLNDTAIENLPQELNNLLPRPQEEGDVDGGFQEQGSFANWEPLAVTRQYDVQAQFDRFTEKLRFSLPEDLRPWTMAREKRDSLHSIACIQNVMLNGFTKTMRRFASAADAVHPEPAPYDATDAANAAKISKLSGQHVTRPVMAAFMDGQMAHPSLQGSLPFVNTMNFDSLDFDWAALPDFSNIQQDNLDDWMWNTMMDDFVMPTL